jgi:hypothetical protein
MLKLILIVMVVAVVAVLVIAATRSDTFRIERTTSIKAPADRIFPFINDFHRWGAWSPWEKIDPALKRSFSGPASGKGAAYSWEGNSKVGSGGMEIAESSPPGKIVIKLDFLKPFEAHNIAEFTLVPGGDSTSVTWAMYGPKPYMAKLIHMFFSMDRMVGGQFEEGLANLKAAAEAAK